MAALQEALKEGESSGAAVSFDIEQFTKTR